jgi:hypothetical protein
MVKPLPIGTVYDGQRIVDVICSDPGDDYQPYCYMLEDGSAVWIPVKGVYVVTSCGSPAVVTRVDADSQAEALKKVSDNPEDYEWTDSAGNVVPWEEVSCDVMAVADE